MSNDEHIHATIKDRIKARIERGDIAMHSRSFFTFKTAALIVVVLLALIVSVLIFNFLFFFIRINDFTPYFHHGPSGFEQFLVLFPWPLLLIDIGLIALAEYLLREFRFAYRSPVLYLLFLIAALAISLGLLIDRATDLNESLEQHAHNHGLPPPLNDLYEHAHHEPEF